MEEIIIIIIITGIFPDLSTGNRKGATTDSWQAESECTILT